MEENKNQDVILEELFSDDIEEDVKEINGIFGNSIPVIEQETVIQVSRNEKHLTINTSDSTVKTKLNHLCEDSPKYWKCTEKGPFSTYICKDKSLLTLRRKKVKRHLTDEQRKAMAERMRNLQLKRKNQNKKGEK